MRVLAASFHKGGGQAIMPVVTFLEHYKCDVTTWAVPPSNEAFAGVRHYAVHQPDRDDLLSLVDRISPDVVLLGTSAQDEEHPVTIEQSLTLIGRERRIPTLAVLDFWGSYARRFSDLPEGNNLVYLPDRIAVPDSIASASIVKEGISQDRIVITGNPFYDNIAGIRKKWTADDTRGFRGDMGISPEEYVVLFCSGPIESAYGMKFGYTEKTALRELVDEAKAVVSEKRICILVRPHPREKTEGLHGLREIMESFPGHCVLDETANPRDAILASDMIVSHHLSSMLLDAVYLGKMGISLTPGLKPEEDSLPTNAVGITRPMYQTGAIGRVLDQAINDPAFARENDAKSKLIMPDGLAAYRVVEELEALVYGRTSPVRAKNIISWD